jgi:hypothetical protein
MARKTETREIGGVRFEVTQLGFAKSRAVFVRLAKCIGPSFAQLAGTPSLMDLGSTVADAGFARAVETLLANVHDDDLEYFAAELGGDHARYSIDGGDHRPKLDRSGREACFEGRLDLFFSWLAFALEANYSDFFRAIAAAIPKAPSAKTPSAG